MWFNNAIIYQFEPEKNLDLEAALADDAIKPCPPHSRFTYGWLPVITTQLAHIVAGAAVICFGKEERLLPTSVIKRLVNERAQDLEIQRGYAMKRAEKLRLTEDVEFELLPKAFCLEKRLLVLIDLMKNRLIINSSSATQAAPLLALLRKSLPGMALTAITPPENLSTTLANWIKHPNTLPSCFQLASDCVLFSKENEKKRFNCKGCDLPADEIIALLEQGLLAAEISLIWNERIQFTLTNDFQIKRIKCLDYLSDDFKEIDPLDDELQRQDAELVLLAGELRALFDALLKLE